MPRERLSTVEARLIVRSVSSSTPSTTDFRLARGMSNAAAKNSRYSNTFRSSYTPMKSGM